jgi:hypothetical protein
MKNNNLSNISVILQGKHIITRYSKKTPENMHYRSVIQDGSSRDIVCVAPSKSVEFHDDMYNNNIVAEEFIDGTMINLFWDTHDWQIATRSCVGGKNRFYNDVPTFRHMFLESLADEFNLDELPRLSDNNLPLVYSFVLQHMANRIVTPIVHNKVYLVELFEINNKEHHAEINLIHLRENEFAKHLIEQFGFPRPILYKLNCSRTDIRLLKEKYASKQTPYIVQGIVFKNMELGLRAKYRNPNYEVVRKLRGNQSSPLYRFLELNKSGNLSEYLNYYSEEGNTILYYQLLWNNYVKQLHDYYVDCYILHHNVVKSYPYNFKVHMYKLHEDYKETKLNTNVLKVDTYMHSLHPAQQMYVLNYTDTSPKLSTDASDQEIKECMHDICSTISDDQ